MERSLIKQVNKKNMAARLNTRHVKPVVFPNFFGVKRKTSLFKDAGRKTMQRCYPLWL